MKAKTSRFLRRDWLDVGQGHQLYLVQYGNPDGVPVLYLHGGPGAGCSEAELALFDLTRFHVLLLDQRGAGLSRATSKFEHNDVPSLIADIEYVRQWLGLPRLCLAGGSFGATLGLLYSALNPTRVMAQIYWGVFVPSQAGANWLYSTYGAAARFPMKYESFSFGFGSRDVILQHYLAAMHSEDAAIQGRAITAWLQWEQMLALPNQPQFITNEYGAKNLAQTELHFALHNYFDAHRLLKDFMGRIVAPTTVIQGERDNVCPPHLFQQYQSLFRQGVLAYQLVNLGYHSLADDKMFAAVRAAIAGLAMPTPS